MYIRSLLEGRSLALSYVGTSLALCSEVIPIDGQGNHMQVLAARKAVLPCVLYCLSGPLLPLTVLTLACTTGSPLDVA